MTESDEGFDCPNCCDPVPGGALACPSCGADEDTGWSEDTMYDGLGLPDEAFDDRPAPTTRQGSTWFQWVVIAMVGLILLFLLGRLF